MAKKAKAYCSCDETGRHHQKMKSVNKFREVEAVDDQCPDCGHYVFWSIDIKKNKGYPDSAKNQEKTQKKLDYERYETFEEDWR